MNHSVLHVLCNVESVGAFLTGWPFHQRVDGYGRRMWLISWRQCTLSYPASLRLLCMCYIPCFLLPAVSHANYMNPGMQKQQAALFVQLPSYFSFLRGRRIKLVYLLSLFDKERKISEAWTEWVFLIQLVMWQVYHIQSHLQRKGSVGNKPWEAVLGILGLLLPTSPATWAGCKLNSSSGRCFKVEWSFSVFPTCWRQQIPLKHCSWVTGDLSNGMNGILGVCSKKGGLAGLHSSSSRKMSPDPAPSLWREA